MLASLGKENTAADIKGAFELKLASRSKKQRLAIVNHLINPNKEITLQRDKSEPDLIDMDDLSSISSVRSDNELWDSIDMRRGSRRMSRLEKISAGSEQQKNRMNKENDLFYPSSENFVDKDTDLKTKLEKYESTIDKLKEAHRIEITTLSETIRNRSKDMLLHKAEELKRHFEREIRNMTSQLTEAKRLLTIKEAEIVKLKDLAQQQEASLNLIKSNGIYKQTFKTSKSLETNNDDSAYSKEELSALKKELESMKSILLTFKRDDEAKTRELAKTRQEMNNLIRQHAENIQAVTREIERKYKDVEDLAKLNEIKYKQVYKELEKFKLNADLEIKVLKALNERYKQKNENTVPPLKEGFPKARGSTALTDILNTSVGSEALQSRYSSLPHNTSYEHKPRVRAASKGRPGLDSLEAPSLTAFESVSGGVSTNPKSKVTFVDSTKNETGRNVSMEM